MARRRIKFMWGGSELIKGNWFFGLVGLYDRQEGEREDGVAISVRGLLGWAAGLTVAGYLAATALLFSVWQQNPYCLLTYGDAFFYPVRRAEVRVKKGQAFIAEGQDLIKAQKWLDGTRLLRHGLALFPSDLNARLSLARFHLLVNQRAEALEVLRAGMAVEYPGRAYLRTYFEAAGLGEDHGVIVTVSDQYLASLKGTEAAAERPWLLAQKFSALIAAHRGAEALALAESEPAGPTALEHRVLALLELKRSGEAVDFLAQQAAKDGADLNLVRRLQVRAFRDAGRIDDMERAIEELRRLSPGTAQPLVYGVVQRVLAGREDLAKKALDDYLFRFGGTAANLQLAAEPLAEIGSVPLFEIVKAAAAERGYPMLPLRMLSVQLSLKTGAWAKAAAELALIKPVPGERSWKAREQIWYEWMSRLVASFGTQADVGSAALLEFFRNRPWPLSMFQPSITALRAAGRTETARDLAVIAETSFPNSAWVKAEKKAISEELATKQSVAAPPPPPPPRPVPAAAPVAAPAVAAKRPAKEPVIEQKPAPTEADFTAGLAEAVRGEKWKEAQRLIAEMRQVWPKPEWLTKRDGEIQLAEIRMARGLNDKPALLLAMRLYLNGSVDRANSALILANEYYENGDKATGVLLVQEVVRSVPNHGIAKRTLAEWQQPAAK